MTAPWPATPLGPPPQRPSLWRQIATQVTPEWTTTRYIALARTGPADPGGLTGNAREDVARLATALSEVLDLHIQDGRGRCEACSAGPFLVQWPCRTRRAVEDGLHHGWPTPAELAGPDPAPEPHEAFAVAVLATHDVLPAAGGQPARCRTCHTPPDRCPVWALAEGFLGITWTRHDPPAGTAVRAR
ncbi:MAG TPA: hypothetical protein VFX70_20275 [Mycobacteriales bacterium]|nr:hypothetical protein [Mycobacteriales bacterium]